MKNFEGKLAVITGGGTGMGRELARQLVTAGCQVAMCDVSLETMAETRELCEQDAPQGVVSTFQADVADEQQVLAFRDAVQHVHDTDHIHLLFNNAGIGGGGSFINDSRQEWDRTFGVCWSGVYFCTRAFMPMLLASVEAYYQHEQRQWILGFFGARELPYRLLRCQVRGERILGGSGDRLASLCPAREGIGGHARTHWYRHC